MDPEDAAPRLGHERQELVAAVGDVEVGARRNAVRERAPGDARVLRRGRAAVVDADAMAAARQRLGEADERAFGAAERRRGGHLAVEGNAVIGKDDFGHERAGSSTPSRPRKDQAALRRSSASST